MSQNALRDEIGLYWAASSAFVLPVLGLPGLFLLLMGCGTLYFLAWVVGR